MNILCDIDGTISSAPEQLCEVLCALHDAGNYVAIVSGSGKDSPSGNTWQEKANYLQSLGITKCWDTLVVVDGDIPALKAQYCKDHDVQLCLENNIPNAKAMIATGVPMVLVPWDSRVKSE